MEKLIKLLNEYEKSITEIPVYWGQTNGVFQYGSYIQQVSVMYMISKHYGFIKWLVDNDKIDRDKLEKKVLKEDLIRKFDEGLIMLLSISDHPIEDLCKLLK